jgi:hypothetical protein
LQLDGDISAVLEAGLANLRRDWSRLSARIRTLEHDVIVANSRVTLRLHYPALRNASPTVADLVDAIAFHIPHFCLPRGEVEEAYRRAELLNDFDRHLEMSRLDRQAVDLFMRANLATGRNGEAGELLLYLLTEWILGAPQMLAKMSLKTNRDMPVHGPDGLHLKICDRTANLMVLSGEAKLHSSLSGAIRSAVSSIVAALDPAAAGHELELVRRHLPLSGLGPTAKQALLAFLDPFDEASNRRVDVVTCLLAFDFKGYAELGDDAEAVFRSRALRRLQDVSSTLADALQVAGLRNQGIELFLFPLPSVRDFRDLFQQRIGWRK